MTPHSVTGLPPFELFFGRPVQVLNRIRSPDDVVFVELTPEQYQQIAVSKRQKVSKKEELKETYFVWSTTSCVALHTTNWSRTVE